MTHPTRSALDAAIDDALRGHRPHEYEGAAARLAAAAKDYIDHVEAERLDLEREPQGDVEKMAYWARRVVDNDGALTADSSMSLDMAHDELTKAAESYLGIDRRDLAHRRAVIGEMQRTVTDWCERKGWKGPDSAPVTFGDTMALLHSEVSEALEAYRDWKLEDATVSACPQPHGNLDSGHLCKPEGVGSEFADILIRLLDDCDRWGVDLAFEFERKMAYNETREHQHGGRAL